MAAPAPDITPILDKLRSEGLGSEHDWRAWLVLLLATTAGLMAGRLIAWTLRRLAKRTRPAARPAALEILRVWPGPPAWRCSSWDWTWG